MSDKKNMCLNLYRFYYVYTNVYIGVSDDIKQS